MNQQQKSPTPSSTFDQRGQTVVTQYNIGTQINQPPPLGIDRAKPYTDLSHLAPAAPYFFGREAEKSWLDQQLADSTVALALLRGGPGAGKSAVLAQWLAEVYPARRQTHWIFGWSFSGQGREGENSAGDFFQAIAKFFQLPGQSPAEQAAELAVVLQQKPVILALDGLEALQGRVGQPGAGKLADHALVDLLRSALALGLCENSLIALTSHQDLADFAEPPSSNRAVLRQCELEGLSQAEAADLLRQRFHADGREQDWQRVLRDMQGHPLSLVLLGGLLQRRFGGRLDKYTALETALRAGGEAEWVERMLAYYVEEYWPKPKWTERFGDWRDSYSRGDEPVFLALLGLFDAPLRLEEFNALLNAPEEKAYTELRALVAPLRLRRGMQLATAARYPIWQQRRAAA